MHKQRVRFVLVVCGWLAVLSGVLAFLNVGDRISQERWPVLWVLLNNTWLVCVVLFGGILLLSLEVIRTIKHEERGPWRESLLAAMRFKLLMLPFYVVLVLLGVVFLVFGMFFGVTLPLFLVTLLTAWLIMRASSLDVLQCTEIMWQEGLLTEGQRAAYDFYQKVIFVDVISTVILAYKVKKRS